MSAARKHSKLVLAAALVISSVAPALAPAPASAARAIERRDFSGLVKVGGGRSIFVECRGQGSPTVVLISGQGNDGHDWSQVLDPADPVHVDPLDQVGAGQGDLHDSDQAVFPQVARTTRVCAYDRPDTRTKGAKRSTPRAQPHTVDADVDDLRRVLRAVDAPKPYVLVAHSYGGFIAELYARTHPADVGGLVMVDAVSSTIGQSGDRGQAADVGPAPPDDIARAAGRRRGPGRARKAGRRPATHPDPDRRPQRRQALPRAAHRISDRRLRCDVRRLDRRTRPPRQPARRRARHEDEQRPPRLPVLPRARRRRDPQGRRRGPYPTDRADAGRAEGARPAALVSRRRRPLPRRLRAPTHQHRPARRRRDRHRRPRRVRPADRAARREATDRRDDLLGSDTEPTTHLPPRRSRSHGSI